jgi:hypothetical protein
MQRLKFYLCVFAVVAMCVFSRSASAQWSNGSYSYTPLPSTIDVLVHTGSYTIGSGASGGDVDATCSSSGSSSISVRFHVTFTGTNGGPNLNAVGHGTLTGSGTGSHYSGGAGVQAQTGGQNNPTFQQPNSLNSNVTLGGETTVAPPGPVSYQIIASASAGVMGSGSTCTAHSTVWYAF